MCDVNPSLMFSSKEGFLLCFPRLPRKSIRVCICHILYYMLSVLRNTEHHSQQTMPFVFDFNNACFKYLLMILALCFMHKDNLCASV